MDADDANDRRLGMGRSISRRDFLNGVGAVAAGALVPGCVTPAAIEPSGTPASYPPLRDGLRGSHPGSFEVAHDLVLRGRRDWGSPREPDPHTYDLVVVGGGISGLAAAYLQLERDPGSRILILDNHDDFGGHARRNEFQIGDRTVIGYGGSQTLESPQGYSDTTKQLLRDIGVGLERLEGWYDQDFYRRHGLTGGVFFDRENYGVDRLVRFELVDYSSYIPLAPSPLTPSEAVAQMPISQAAKRELLRLLVADEDLLADVPADQQSAYLATISYRTFLERYFDIREPDVFALLTGISTDLGVPIEMAPAVDLLSYVGMPGIGATSLPRVGFGDDPYIAHFPDGNASIARMLVRAMIPRVAAGSTMDDIVGARFEYARLDEPNSAVRLRLGSTVVRVEHEGPAESAERVAVSYVRAAAAGLVGGGQPERVWARSCVMAGYNAMIPHLCPELPDPQRKALALAVKVPILYSTVLLRDWRAWERLGVAVASAPGSYHANAMLDFPVSLGGYEFSHSPDDPILVHMERFEKPAMPASTPRDVFRAGRYQMLGTPFADIEREIRTQLTGMLEPGGFDPARDIAAITANRWSHGYSYGQNPLFDPAYAEGEAPNEIGRARFGRIAVANSDAGGRATIDSAIDQANRAIEDLTGS
jgi:spermidine dehydrogenase